MKKEYQYLFYERLEDLMSEKGYTPHQHGVITKLARDMINEECCPFLVNDDPQKRIEAAKKAIARHLETDSASQIEGRWIKAYCDFFGCSADYLFGYIDSENHSLTDIGAYTGLSDNSTRILHRLSGDQRDALNSIIESRDFIFLLSDISKYKGSINEFNEAASDFRTGIDSMVHEISGKKKQTDRSKKIRADADARLSAANDKWDAMEFKISKDFNNIVDSIKKKILK